MDAINHFFQTQVSVLLEGTLTALQIFGLTLLFSLPLGMLIAKLRMSKFALVRSPIRLYLLVMRGTPLMLQLLFFMYVPSLVFGFKGDNRFLVAILAFSLNYAAYFAEIYRGGLESIPVGQYEAAAVLGLSRSQAFRRIILPQLFKRILPTCANECMTLVKDTSLAQVIGVIELFRQAKNLTSSSGSVTPIIVAGLFYLVMNSVVALVFSRLEKKTNYYKG